MILKNNILNYIKAKKSRLASRVAGKKFFIFQVGDNEASNRYVRNKIKDCEEVGIVATLLKFPEDVTESTLIQHLLKIRDGADAIMIQLPLPPHISIDSLLDYIPKEKDVDGFKIDSPYEPCTPLGIMRFLRDAGFQFDGARVVIIGRSNIVGKPLARMMTDANATVTLCHSRTRDLDKIVNDKDNDLIVCAVGKADFLDCSQIDCPVIDVGINFKDGKMVGDCYNTEGKNVSPVPGGVGLLTRLALLENIGGTKEC